MSLSSIRSHWKRLLLPALVIALLAAWAVPAQMQAPTGSPQAHEICGSPRFEGVAKLLRDTVEWKPLSEEALRAEGKLSAQGEVLLDTVGQERQFWARDLTSDTTAFYQVTATCMKVSDHAYLYLESGASVADQELTNIINEFENNIYTKDRATFGDEPSPGIDSDGHVYLLLLDILDGWNGTTVLSYVAGYFDAVNEYPNDPLYLPDPYLGHSNQKEMLYIDISPAEPSSTDSYGTVAHEFQHMIHWNMSDTVEETWVDEGCADLAQFLCGYGHPSSHLVSGSPSSPGFLEEPDHQLTQTGSAWNSEPHILASYGAAYLWTLYLWEHYGGDATIQVLVDDEGTGITGVNDTLTACGYSDDFEDVFRKWVVANYLDDGTGPYGYDSIELLAGGSPDYHNSFPRPAPSAAHSSYPVATSEAGVEDWAADAIVFTGAGSSALNLTFGGDGPFAATVVRSSSASFQPGTNTVSSMALNAIWSGSTNVSGAEAVLLIPASLSQAGGHTYNYGAWLGDTSGTHYTYLPLVLRAPAAPTPVPQGINGKVTRNGAAAPNLKLDLVRSNSTSDTIVSSLRTSADGSYHFLSIPGLSSGQSYSVQYMNTSGTPNPGSGYLFSWYANWLGSYAAGADAAGGDFDVVDFPLVAPADGASRSLPVTFQWTPRNIANESYQVVVYNWDRDGVGFSPLLDHTGSFTAGSLPAGWQSGDLLLWWVTAYQNGGSVPYNYGDCYDTHILVINFSSSPGALGETGTSINLGSPSPAQAARIEALRP